MKYHIKNFKCINEAQIELNQLTVLSGTHTEGMSAVVQSLLLFRRLSRLIQFDIGGDLLDFSKSLNGQFILSLGKERILPNNSSDSKIQFEFSDEKNQSIGYVQIAADRFPVLALQSVVNMYKPLLSHVFYYLHGDRKVKYEASELDYLSFPHTGYHGEYTAQVLDSLGGVLIVDKKRHVSMNTFKPFLMQQTHAWLKHIISDVNNKDEYLEPVSTITRVGCGYVLPIIVTGLLAEAGSMFIVEKPESCLDHTGQYRIGEFLATVSQSGVHIVVNTQSDYVLLGIRTAILNNIMSYDLVTLNIFDTVKEAEQPKITQVQYTENGRLNSPEFFAQVNKKQEN
jgi:predicted ATPase